MVINLGENVRFLLNENFLKFFNFQKFFLEPKTSFDELFPEVITDLDPSGMSSKLTEIQVHFFVYEAYHMTKIALQKLLGEIENLVNKKILEEGKLKMRYKLAGCVFDSGWLSENFTQTFEQNFKGILKILEKSKSQLNFFNTEHILRLVLNYWAVKIQNC